VATQIILFPQHALSSAAPSTRPATENTPKSVPLPTRPAPFRYRGLHLVNAGDTPQLLATPESTQERAIQIVAQVEREIERRTLREREHYLQTRISFAASLPQALPVTPIDTQTTVAQRLFAALLSFARPA
jgi:hypothetical protein